MASRRSYDIGDSINKCKKYVFVAVLVPIILSQLPIVVSVRYQIITVSVDLESGIHMWSRSYCQTLSKHFRSDKLFLLEQARRLKSQKACYGGILCFFSPPPKSFHCWWALKCSARWQHLQCDEGFPSSPTLLQPRSSSFVLLGSFKGILHLIYITFIASHIIVMWLPAPDMKQKGKVHVTTAPGLFAQKVVCVEADVSRAEHEALIRVCM